MVRPELLRQADGPAPLVVVHGGPQVPSDYLFGLSGVGDDRAVVFYDQLGCGRSDEPSEGLGEVYSLASSLRDLRGLLRSLRLERYHIYGQSWGGMLAAELVGAEAAPRLDARIHPPLSVTLSNTPTSVDLVEAEAGRLLQACNGDVEAFMAAHNCRVAEKPQPLADAYAHAGTTWRGSGAISGLEVSAAAMGRIACPALVMRGDHDFVTEECVQGWSAMPDVTFVTIDDASHHALLEQPEAYLDTLGAFLRKHDC